MFVTTLEQARARQQELQEQWLKTRLYTMQARNAKLRSDLNLLYTLAYHAGYVAAMKDNEEIRP